MYRCGICRRSEQPKKPRKLLIAYRTITEEVETMRGLEIVTRDEIAKEVSICHSCYEKTDGGSSLVSLPKSTRL